MESGRTRPNQEITVKLAQHIDAFENYSRPHSRLMADLAARLAQRLGLLQQDINAIAEAALLHDIGLFQMSPRYLLTPGPLGREDRIDLWRHPIIGEQEMAKRGASRHAQLLVRWHHEWWNGSGYPDMLSLEDIPIGARILRSVDLYSALTSDRPYRPRFEETVAREELRSSAGTECDPYVIHVLLRLLDELQPAVSAPIEAPIEGPVKQQSEDVIEQGAGPFQGRLSEAERIDGSQSTPPTEQLPGDEPVTTQPLGSSPAESAAAETSTLVQAPLPAAENVHSTQPGAGPAESGAQSPAVIQPPETAQSPAARGFTARAPLAIPATRTAPVEICRGWRSSAYNTKSLLGFEVSVLRQLEFRSIAIPMCGWARLVRYLKPWGKQIMSNDPRAWGAAASRAALDDGAAFGDEQITELLEDVYIPGVRFENPALQSWFGEVDGWFMDNLRRRIEALAEPLRSHALALGMRTGDYAQSFPKETLDLKHPLTDVFRNLARTTAG
ncbi:MAG TPA: HD domain-containing phosphohydrolase, partial [Blastocatellia bacterium]|nr:HD domain-containing phosphohydrolase [Blastocatellia bacterium]